MTFSTKRFSRHDGIVLSAALAALALFLYLAPGLFPENCFQKGADKGTIIVKAARIAEELGYSFENTEPQIQMQHDDVQLRYLYTELGAAGAIATIRDTIPVFQWRISWNPESIPGDSFLQNRQFDEENNRAVLFLDLNGEPLKFQAPAFLMPPGQSENEEADRSAALLLAQRVFRNDGSKWTYGREEDRGRGALRTRRYTWRRETPAAGQVVDLTVDVRRGRVLKFEKKYPVPKQYLETENGNLPASFLVFWVIVLLVLMTVYFVKRLRSDQLDLKSGLLPAGLAAAGTVCWLLLGQLMGNTFDLNVLISSAVITAVFTGSIWAFFCVSDSLAREEWPEKLFTFDVLKRKILFPATGLAIFRGVALALVCLGAAVLLGKAGMRLPDSYYPMPAMSSRLFFPSPVRLLVIGELLLRSVFTAVFFLFLVTLLRRWFKKNIWVLLPALLLFSAVSPGVPRPMPVWETMVMNGVVGLLFTLFFLRYDFLTVLTGAFTLPVIFYGIMLCLSGSGFWLYGAVLLLILLMLLMYALRAFHSDTSAEEVSGFVPDYIQRVYERERIQRELDIARHVQLTFLPASNPQTSRLDIASVCLPAKEVGGDYFDFIRGPESLGVVIGDVSGKGISAAFYMTLTKGFLKSQTEIHSSPREILIQMNKLFYENAERGMFISMIIGVFDFTSSTLTFARAGHNPMIFYRAQTGLAEEVEVPGIALGLDKGEIFSRTIREKTIQYNPNDIFLFYTDGINEAKDTARNEFGEERLMHIIETGHQLPAGKLLAKIQQNLENFTAGELQHDDITAILVKTR